MEDSSKPKHKFTNLCREVMWLTDSLKQPLFGAIILVEPGFNKGGAIHHISHQQQGGSGAGQEDQMLRSRVVIWLLVTNQEIQVGDGSEVDGEF